MYLNLSIYSMQFMIKFSEYNVKVNIYDKHGNFLFYIYDNECSILIDESIYNLLRKITYMYNKYFDVKLEHTMLYLYSLENYNILLDSNIKSINILNEIVEDYILISNKQKLNDPIYTVFGFVDTININIMNAIEEIDIILNFYFGRFNEKLLTEIYQKYINTYFPLLTLFAYKSIINKIYKYNKEDDSFIHSIQREINELDIIDNTDINFLGSAEVKNIFIIYYPKLISNELNIDKLLTNMIFLNDLFLDLFENINISKNITSVILQTPQFISQKGLVNKELNKINTYKLTIKGNINMFGGLITFTNEFDINKCRSYISFNNHSINVIFNENILTILEYINKIISSKFIIIKVNSYNIDFFNIKCPILKIIDIIQVIQIIKKYSEYFFIIKDSLKSVYIKYRIGQFQNVLNNLYNKLYTIINKGNELTQEQLYKFKVEYNIEYNDLNIIINDIKMKINSSYRERGIGIQITDSYINISGLTNTYLSQRLLFLTNRIFNLSTTNKSKVVNKINKQKIENEYMKYIKHLDTFLQNKTDIYWCKSCQNYGNKIRKPIMYKEIPDEYEYDKDTNTYINKNGNRIIEIETGIYFGCDTRKSNLNKYIGFIKTCSLCCFQEDQFISTTNSAKRKIMTCWNDKVKVNKTNYIYNYSRMIGDISLMLDEYSQYFNDEYLCILDQIGPFNKIPKIGELIFIDAILLNPNMWKKDMEYKIYIYQNPFLHKVVLRSNTNIDLFSKTPIDDFIISCNKIFNSIIPYNCYSIYFKYSSEIKKYSFIENMNIIIFIFNNDIVLSIVDKTLKFGEYVGMFEDIKYVNKYKLPTFKYLNDKLKTSLDNLIKTYNLTSILIDNDGDIFGLCLSLYIYVLFEPISEEEFNKYTNNEYKDIQHVVNITITSFIYNSLKVYSIDKLINDDMYEMYIYNLFKYNFFIYLNKYENIKQELLNILSKYKDIKLRYVKIKNKINDIFSNDLNNFLTISNSDINKLKLDIINDLSLKLNQCKYPYVKIDNECKLEVTEKLKIKLLNNIINELIYPYSSVYIYMSKYINNSYTHYNIIDKNNTNMINLIQIPLPKIVGNKYIQEIYQYGNEINNIALYRALANIYFWNKMKHESDLQRKNLGYYSNSQTFLAYYIYSIIKENNILKILNEFKNKFVIDINLVIENENIQIDNNLNYYLYINIKNGIIISISVAFII